MLFCFWMLLLFFKQKTAYEMRISDWSSDVCSSDLLPDDPVIGLGRWGKTWLHAGVIDDERHGEPPECERRAPPREGKPSWGWKTAEQGDRKSTRLNSSH